MGGFVHYLASGEPRPEGSREVWTTERRGAFTAMKCARAGLEQSQFYFAPEFSIAVLLWLSLSLFKAIPGIGVEDSKVKKH